MANISYVITIYFGECKNRVVYNMMPEFIQNHFSNDIGYWKDRERDLDWVDLFPNDDDEEYYDIIVDMKKLASELPRDVSFEIYEHDYYDDTERKFTIRENVLIAERGYRVYEPFEID